LTRAAARRALLDGRQLDERENMKKVSIPQNRSKQVNNTTRVNVLIEALPYIRKYRGKIVVIKYGGAALIDNKRKEEIMSDIVLMSLCGIKIVLVHGGGPEINAMLEKIGKQPQFIDGLRYTDKETMDIVQMVLGKINKELVATLMKEHRGAYIGDFMGEHMGHAVGLCGLDSSLLVAEQLNKKLGYVGEITKVNTEVINDLIDKNYIPVIAPYAGDENENVYNINADIAASKIAAAVGAHNLILITDVAGILEDKNDEETLIHTLTINEVAAYKEKGIISGGMIPKTECCVNAVQSGVDKANIIDGRIPHSILLELLTDKGAGSMIIDS